MIRWLPLVLLCVWACARDGRLADRGRDGGSCSVLQQGEDAQVACSDGTGLFVRHGSDGGKGDPGQQGPQGLPGETALPPQLLRLVQQDDCPGGVLVQGGVDGDRDGVLGDGEVQGTWPICPPAPTCTSVDGSVLFRSSWDMAEFLDAGCTEVTGDVNVYVPGLPDLSSLRNLRRVGGTLSIVGTAVSNLDDLSRLREVGRLQLLGNPDLESLAGLGGLARARFIDLSGLPRLASLHGLEGLAALEDLSMDGTGVVDLAPLAGLTVSPGGVAFTNNPLLRTIELPSTAGWLGSLVVTGNDALTSIEGLRPRLVTDALIVSRNRALPTCEAQHLLDSLGVEPGYVEITGNLDTGECP